MSARLPNLFGSSGNVLTWILRAVFLALIIGIATNVLIEQMQLHNGVVIAILCFVGILLAGAAIVLADLFVKNKQITTISAVYFGLLMGFLLGSLFWEALRPIVASYLADRAIREWPAFSWSSPSATSPSRRCYRPRTSFASSSPTSSSPSRSRGLGRWCWIPVSSLTAESPIFVIRGLSTPR